CKMNFTHCGSEAPLMRSLAVPGSIPISETDSIDETWLAIKQHKQSHTLFHPAKLKNSTPLPT
ncbi:MAG: hypothetical protein J6D44_09890, partial [Pseudomonas sp.]|nr:hypothetical protein [Pseudomonas sp.]